MSQFEARRLIAIKIMMAPALSMTTVFFCPHCRKILGISKAR